MLRLSVRAERPDFHVAADLRVEAGRCVCLLGPTGAGKSTLLLAVAGVEPSSGAIELDGDRLDALAPWKRGTALVPQRPRPLPGGRVRDHVAFACPQGRLDGVARALIDDYHLAALADRPARSLSGGELQRLAIVQALASRPRVVLLDEPLSAQDAGRRRLLGERLRAYAHETGVPVLWATHDLGEAQRVADAVAVLEGGRVVVDAPVERMLEAPPSWPVARLLGYDGWVPAGDGRAWLIHPDLAALADGEAAAHAEGLRLAGVVAGVRPAGGLRRLQVRLEAGGEAEVTLAAAAPVPPAGTCVTVVLAGPPPSLPLPDAGPPL